MSPPGVQRFPRASRLRARRDFQRISREGIRVTTPSFLLLVATRFPACEGAPARLGLTVSRRVGGAVTRNRVKRRIREWFRRNRSALPLDRDLVVIARPAAARLEGCEIEREFVGAIPRLAAARSR